jgi:hypothetical protein
MDRQKDTRSPEGRRIRQDRRSGADTPGQTKNTTRTNTIPVQRTQYEPEFAGA